MDRSGGSDDRWGQGERFLRLRPTSSENLRKSDEYVVTDWPRTSEIREGLGDNA
jgi:hypothetical protein